MGLSSRKKSKSKSGKYSKPNERIIEQTNNKIER
jgi:hypothetical protein